MAKRFGFYDNPADQGIAAARAEGTVATYPAKINGRWTTVSVPESDYALETAVALLTDLVVGYDQGGREVSDVMIGRVRAFLRTQGEG